MPGGWFFRQRECREGAGGLEGGLLRPLPSLKRRRGRQKTSFRPCLFCGLRGRPPAMISRAKHRVVVVTVGGGERCPRGWRSSSTTTPGQLRSPLLASWQRGIFNLPCGTPMPSRNRTTSLNCGKNVRFLESGVTSGAINALPFSGRSARCLFDQTRQRIGSCAFFLTGDPLLGKETAISRSRSSTLSVSRSRAQ